MKNESHFLSDNASLLLGLTNLFLRNLMQRSLHYFLIIAKGLDTPLRNVIRSMDIAARHTPKGEVDIVKHPTEEPRILGKNMTISTLNLNLKHHSH